MDSLAVAFLGVIALSTLVQAILLVGLAVAGRRAERRLTELTERIERDIQPSLTHVARAARNAAEASDLAVIQARRVDTMLAELGERVDEAGRIAQQLVLRPLKPLGDIAALIKGVRKGLDVFRRLGGLEAGRRRSTHRSDGDDEHLFI
jgi:hypothetical protein